MSAALALHGIAKAFGAVQALHDATLVVRPGTVHAVLGENGAGKSTLMRVAYGLVAPDAGTISRDGRAVTLRGSADALALGIGMVHQHFTLVPAMTVAENVALGRRGRYDPAAAAERVRRLGEATGLVLDPQARAGDLPVGGQQRLEIVKALAREARVLILDEPTAVLAPSEADDLMAWIAAFRDRGHAVVLITHKLREALRVADDVTVLRRGRTVLAAATATVDEATLVRAMLGDDTASEPPRAPAVLAIAAGAPVAQLRDVWARDARGAVALRGVSLSVHPGEIVGIAAVEGSGQHALLRVLAGRQPADRGEIACPSQVAFIPEDRHRDAVVLPMTLTENVALQALAARSGRMPWRALADATSALLERFDVRAPGPAAAMRTLSGGNQQKLVLARELASAPPLVVAENPTRGLDIRASAAVRDALRAAQARGSGVVVYSSDLDEVLALATRVVVVHAGRVLDVAEGTREAVGRAMLGVEGAAVTGTPRPWSGAPGRV